MFLRRALAAGLIVVSSAATAACGDSGGDDDVHGDPTFATTTTSAPTTAAATSTTGTATLFEVSSPAFSDGDPIPVEYTCDGDNARPVLSWSGPPDHETIAVVVDDPDAPGGSFIHWIAWGFSGQDGTIAAGELSAGVTEAPTSIGQPGWIGPCPPFGVHRYVFHFYALRATPEVGDDPAATWEAIRAVSLQEATLTGTYERPTG